MKNKIASNLVVFIVGLLLFSAGIFLIYPPAAYIGAGIVLMAISLFGGQPK